MNGDKLLSSTNHAVFGSNDATLMTTSAGPPVVLYYPAHFMNGSVIQLAGGDLKRVEDLTTLDFERSASISIDLRLDTSTVVNISPVSERDTVMLTFSVGPQQVQVSVESTVEHPFFVYDRGWSSFSPPRTIHRYQLSCHQLTVGDNCISLTQKNSPMPAGSSAAISNTSQLQAAGALNNGQSSVGSLRKDSRPRLASDSAAVYHFTGKS